MSTNANAKARCYLRAHLLDIQEQTFFQKASDTERRAILTLMVQLRDLLGS